MIAARRFIVGVVVAHELRGVVMAKSAPLAKQKVVTPADLKGLPLFCSDQSWARDIPR